MDSMKMGSIPQNTANTVQSVSSYLQTSDEKAENISKVKPKEPKMKKLDIPDAPKKLDIPEIPKKVVKVDKAPVPKSAEPKNVPVKDGNEEKSGYIYSGYESRRQSYLEELESAAIEITKQIQVVNKGLEFSIHEGTNEVMVKIKDTETNEVIREIPPEKLLDMLAKMRDIAGIMVDERR